MRGIATVVLVAGLLLSACSGDEPADGEEAAASTSPSASPAAGSSTPASPSPSPSASASERQVAVPDPPRGPNNRKARLAFADYVLSGWIYALNTNDARPLLRVSAGTSCAGCPELVRELRRRDRQGWHVEMDGVRVRSRKVSADGSRAVARLRVDIPASDTFYEDGRYRSTNRAHPRTRFVVEMTHRRGRFRLVSFAVYGAAGG